MQNKGGNHMHYPLFPQPLPGLIHGGFTRNGGSSTGAYAGNNISFGVGDDPQWVQSNRNLMKEQLGLDYLVSARQVHGADIHHLVKPVAGDYEADGYDALITDQPGIGVLIQHADCQAVMIYDRVRRLVAAIHNGWRGSVLNIIAQTISEMRRQHGSHPENMVAAVGPSLGPCCSEFVNFREELPDSFLPFQVKTNHFDFWKITKHQLAECGVSKDAVFIAGICSSCSSEYFSYRRARRNSNGVTGRNGTVVALV